MKRSKLIIALTLLLVLTCVVPAGAAESQKETVVPVMNTKTINGSSDLAWQPKGLFIKPDADRILVDYCTYMLKVPLQTKDGVSFILLDDLTALYSPDFKVENKDGSITITHAGVTAQIKVGSTEAVFYTGKGTLAAAPFQKDGEVFVPLMDLMIKGFGKTRSELNGYYGLGNSADFTVTRDDVYNLKMFFRGKDVGKNYWAYWNEDTQSLEPVVVYIPSTYDAEKPNKMVVQLHGAGGNAFRIPDSDNGVLMMREAEKRGYIVMWPNTYGGQCNFGMWVQPAGQLPITDKTDSKNPAGHSEAKLADIKLSGENVQKAMDFVESKWNINEKKVYIMGISMGGCGTWYQAAAYGDRFAAASPSGAFVEPEYFDWSTVKIPTLYVGGTEDRNGFDLMLNAYDIAKSQKANIVEFITVGGAPHGGEWPVVLEETFEFFERYTKN